MLKRFKDAYRELNHFNPEEGATQKIANIVSARMFSLPHETVTHFSTGAAEIIPVTEEWLFLNSQLNHLRNLKVKHEHARIRRAIKILFTI